jgi:hypothetical protein
VPPARPGSDLDVLVVDRHLRLAARNVLADLDDFHLDPEALDIWERLNQRPARPLKGLRELMDRPSPFVVSADSEKVTSALHH